jgi:hypothetical protein
MWTRRHRFLLLKAKFFFLSYSTLLWWDCDEGGCISKYFGVCKSSVSFWNLHCTVTNFFCSMMLLRFTNRRCIGCGEENESQVWSQWGGPWLDRHWKFAFRSIAGIGVALKLNNVARLCSRPLCVCAQLTSFYNYLFCRTLQRPLRTRLLSACAPCAVQEAARVSLFCSQILLISFSSHLQV